MISTCRLHRGRCFASYDTKLEGHKVKFQLNVKNLFDKHLLHLGGEPVFVRWGCAAGELSSTLEF
jgi:iron complex outermembrane receptor protein